MHITVGHCLNCNWYFNKHLTEEGKGGGTGEEKQQQKCLKPCLHWAANLSRDTAEISGHHEVSTQQQIIPLS